MVIERSQRHVCGVNVIILEKGSPVLLSMAGCSSWVEHERSLLGNQYNGTAFWRDQPRLFLNNCKPIKLDR